jgi:hypothetical protein
LKPYPEVTNSETAGYLVTPTLKLEANSAVRRFGWKYAIATLLVCLIPYYSIPAGIIVGTVSLLVSASNASKILLARSLGEQEYARITNEAVLRAPVVPGLFFILLPSLFIVILGAMMLLFFPNPSRDWGFYFALGILGYAFVMAFWYPIRFFRVRSAQRMNVPDHSSDLTLNSVTPPTGQEPRPR